MSDIIDLLKKIDANFSKEQEEKINKKLTEMLKYVPKIGVFGKTGAGKSSLCNALFGKEICPVSDVEACTREPKDVLLSLGGHKGITLLDVPGVGENKERDEEYSELYQKLLPELDLVLWVLKGDERAYSVDIKFYQEIVKPHIKQGKPFIIVLNQIDKVEPYREWDINLRKPSQKQSENINKKVIDVANNFSIKQSLIVPVSAEEKYGLTKLVDEIIFSLPDEKKISIAREVVSENLSSEAKAEVKGSITRVIERTIEGASKGADLGGKIAGTPGKIVGAIVGGIGGFLGLW